MSLYRELRKIRNYIPYSKRWYKDGILHLQEIEKYRVDKNHRLSADEYRRLIQILDNIFGDIDS